MNNIKINDELLNHLADSYLRSDQPLPFYEWLPKELNRLFPKNRKAFFVA